MSAFLGKARGLQQQQAEVEARAGQIQAFLEKFILSDAEVASLRHDPIDKVVPGTGAFWWGVYVDRVGWRTCGVDTRHRLVFPPCVPSSLYPNAIHTGERPFFAALQRVQEIRLGCSQLVGSKHQAAGLEMLEVRV